MAKQFKDEVLYTDDVKDEMRKMIIERIKKVQMHKEQAMHGYDLMRFDYLKSSADAQNHCFRLELEFLNGLLLVK